MNGWTQTIQAANSDKGDGKHGCLKIEIKRKAMEERVEIKVEEETG